ncbi:MAG TPA: arylesterase [Steroidobacteraceae bacterium]
MRTLSRVICAWALGIGFWLIGVQGAAATQGPPILVFGDSLSAGYGLHPDEGWVPLLQQRLKTQGYGTPVVNASVSGETTGGGLERLPRALQLHKPSLVILELGANDGLRGLPIPGTRANLAKMVAIARAGGARVLLLGMRLPPNYGPRYANDFRQMFSDIAEQDHVPFVPFLLESVALHPDLVQADGLHPNARGAPLMLNTVWPQLVPLLHPH